jgi:RNA polymerase sigma factor (sigma-70 family)
MASVLTSGAALRHLRDLFNGGSSVGLSDGQLLARYAADRDGPAFAALVARHGPMVAATCRAILRHEHDVEDAFQATFLVLARKASSVHAGDALGGWLHRVAYRVAVQANIGVQRRRRRESEVSAMEIPAATRPGLDGEVYAIVHEEIDRLPDRHRLPVVLCDLEGLSYDQAASRLGWTVPALRCRLSKARERLRGRLTRRGVAGAALGVVIASSDASASVPAAWASAVVSSATGGASSAVAVALSQTILRGMLMTKLKIVAATTLASAGIVSAGVFAIGAGRPDEPKRVMNPPAAVRTPLAADHEDAAPGAMIEVRGRVVDPDGHPVAGANVRTGYLDREIKPAPEATSGPDGRFFLRVPPWRRNSVLRHRDAMYPWVVASAPGFGPGWASAVREPGAPDEVTIRLVEDGPPIEGRIVDLEGRPVAGARVKLEQVWFAREGQISDWLARAEDVGVQGPWRGLEPLPTTIAAKTDADGRFRLAGIGRDRIAELIVAGPTIATSELYVLNRDGPAIGTIDKQAMAPRPSRTTYHARRFEFAAEPTKPIEGVIRDKDTGRPITGLTLRGMVYEQGSLVPAPGIETTTDAQGHYRLTGLPKGPAYRLFLEPGDGLPYTKATFRVPAESPALEPVNFDITLKRGILVRGRVTDKTTGKPVSGYINSYTFADNPQINEFPGYRSSYQSYARIEDDGRYEVVALPGRGLIACRSDLGLYRGGVGAEAIQGYDTKNGFFRTSPQVCVVHDYHVLAEVNLDPKSATATVDLQVDPGRSFTINVIDPEGKPVGGTNVSGLTDLFSTIEYEQESPTIEIHALDPSKPRRVTVTHAGRKLVGSVYLKGDESGPLTIRLQPWGTILGRIVDEDGKPRGSLGLSNTRGIYPQPPADQGLLPGRTSGPGIRLGRDGRFRIEGLVPGLKYGASASTGNMFLGAVFRDVIVAPGEVKDLGDLKAIPPDPNGQE